MKINPDSLNGPNRADSLSEPSKAEKAFKDIVTAQTGQTMGSQPLANVAQAFTKTELTDPAKADVIVQQAVHEMMGREFGAMRQPDREQVAKWLSSDPLVRETMLRYVRSLAS
jgi:hypothetical protein